MITEFVIQAEGVVVGRVYERAKRGGMLIQ
jgi:hypothetical protein